MFVEFDGESDEMFREAARSAVTAAVRVLSGRWFDLTAAVRAAMFRPPGEVFHLLLELCQRDGRFCV